MNESLNPVWQSGVTIKDEELTPAQWYALGRLECRHKIPVPMVVFKAINYIGVTTPSGMFIGIEEDGHCHT